MRGSDWSAADCSREPICRESQVYPKRDLCGTIDGESDRKSQTGGLNMIFGEMKTAGSSPGHRIFKRQLFAFLLRPHSRSHPYTKD